MFCNLINIIFINILNFFNIILEELKFKALRFVELAFTCFERKKSLKIPFSSAHKYIKFIGALHLHPVFYNIHHAITVFYRSLFNVQCNLYNVQCRMFTVHCLMYSVYFTLFNVQYIMHTYIVLYTVYTLQYLCTMYAVHSLIAVHCLM